MEGWLVPAAAQPWNPWGSRECGQAGRPRHLRCTLTLAHPGSRAAWLRCPAVASKSGGGGLKTPAVCLRGRGQEPGLSPPLGPGKLHSKHKIIAPALSAGAMMNCCEPQQEAPAPAGFQVELARPSPSPGATQQCPFLLEQLRLWGRSPQPAQPRLAGWPLASCFPTLSLGSGPGFVRRVPPEHVFKQQVACNNPLMPIFGNGRVHVKGSVSSFA